MKVITGKDFAYRRKEVGTTPNADLTKIRMQNGAHLLINGSMPVSDVSNAVGIIDSNYFVKPFKKNSARHLRFTGKGIRLDRPRVCSSCWHKPI
jgi:methylphosphotriester-DNA--protein-cysteine methyltransferase